MSIDDSPRRTHPGPRPTRVRLSGCALRHTEAECDCIRPNPADEKFLCPHCDGCGEVRTGAPCVDCKGWGELYRGGAPTHTYSFPGTSNNADSAAEIGRAAADAADPWATAETVLDADPWTDPGSFEPPF